MGEDYSHFEARYDFTEATADPEMLRHIHWLSSVYGKPTPSKDSAPHIDAKRHLTEQLTFQDSRDSLGLQLSDMLASVALMLLTAGGNLWNAAFAPQPFTRYQFRIQISHLGLALQDAGLYDGEIPEVVEHIYKGMTGYGLVVLTWLESKLFFVNTTNHYSSRLEITADLLAYRAREAAYRSQLADMIEMRMTCDG